MQTGFFQVPMQSRRYTLLSGWRSNPRAIGFRSATPAYSMAFLIKGEYEVTAFSLGFKQVLSLVCFNPAERVQSLQWPQLPY